jgi:hypothetical protein
MIGALLPDFDRQNVTLLYGCRASCVSAFAWSIRLQMDDIFVCALRIGEVPWVIRPSVSSGLGPVTCGAMFSRLSKMLNQENALSAPCLRSDSCSPQAPSRSTGILRKDLISHF